MQAEARTDGVGTDGVGSGSPLRHRRYRHFYIGAVGTALAYTMQSTVAAWLMATLTPSALLVSLVQSASTVPFLLFGLMAGAMADLIARRRVIFMTQLVMMAVTLALGIITMSGSVTPVSLLALTFTVGTGFAFYLPAQQASVNELVARTELPQAIALNAVAFNVSRAAGPALAGFIAAWSGSGWAFVASALGFAPMLLSVRALSPAVSALPGIPETLVSGMMAGLRFTTHSGALKSVLFRNFGFAFSASALLGLLPLIARDQLNLGPGGYGLLFGVFGAGAVAAALVMPRLLRRYSLNTVVLASVAVWAVAAVLVGLATHTALAVAGCAMAGGSWVSALAGLSAGAQSTAPAWVRARVVAVNNLVTQTSIALGGLVWGILAAHVGLTHTLWAAAATIIVVNLAGYGVRVRLGEANEVTPMAPLPDMMLAVEPMPDDGPVLVQREYRIDADRRSDFLRAIRVVEATRRRNGATSWRVFRDVAEADRFVERYIISSWAEYVRLRSRMTMSDRILQDRAASFQRPGVPIRTSRLIGVDPAEELTDHREPDGQGAVRSVDAPIDT